MSSYCGNIPINFRPAATLFKFQIFNTNNSIYQSDIYVKGKSQNKIRLSLVSVMSDNLVPIKFYYETQ